jgi:hypothetical protein
MASASSVSVMMRRSRIRIRFGRPVRGAGGNIDGEQPTLAFHGFFEDVGDPLGEKPVLPLLEPVILDKLRPAIPRIQSLPLG